MKGKGARFALLILLVAALALFWALGGAEWLSLDRLKDNRDALISLIDRRPLVSAALFGLIYVAAVALSVPGAAVLTLAAGALFGLALGVLVASISSTIGATLAMLAARFIARDWVRARFPGAVQAMDKGVARDGNVYLLSLRLAPVFPFFLINLGMGLTAMPPLRFAILTAIGALPGTIVYTYAGTALIGIDSLSEILSPQLLGAFLGLALLPLIGKRAARWIVRRKARRGFRRPKRFDANVIVIGAGSAGLVASLVATELQGRVILIERGEMGGDCLNTGCVPSKSLIRSARLAQALRGASRFGIHAGDVRVDFAAAMARVRQAIEAIAPNDSVERFEAMGVDVRLGTARLVDPWTVELDGGERVSAASVIIASGARPVIPDIPGLAESGFVTSDTLWTRLATLAKAPARVVVFGGGPIGCELGQALAQLGSAVTIVTLADRLLDRDDSEASALVEQALARDGVAIRLGRSATRIKGGTVVLDDGERLPFDLLIVAIGRKASFEGLGLEDIGIDPDAPLERQSREPWPHIRFAGDAAGGFQFTHFAGHSGAIAAINAIGAPIARLATDDLVPRVTYTSPEVAAVGLAEDQARSEGRSIEIVRYLLHDLDRAVIDGSTEGFVKLVVKAGSDRVLGATIVGAQAGELIMPWVLAIKRRIGLKRMLGVIYPYPTMSEASRSAAGEWRKAHKPHRLLAIVRRVNAWRRGS